MLKSSLIYVEKDGCYLMLHRVKKQADCNKDKWIGVGGKFEPGETPEMCAAREMREETGLTPASLSYRAVITFISDEYGTEEMHLFTCTAFEGELTDCDEGTLEWVKKTEVPLLNIWEGDKIFLKMLADDEPFFRLTLTYKGDKLQNATRTE